MRGNYLSWSRPSRDHPARPCIVAFILLKNNAKIQHFFDICNTLSPNSRHLSRQCDYTTHNPIHLTFYLLWGPQSKPAERLLWGESVEQYVALHKGFARNRASISLSIKKVKSKKYRIIIIHRAGTRPHEGDYYNLQIPYC